MISMSVKAVAIIAVLMLHAATLQEVMGVVVDQVIPAMDSSALTSMSVKAIATSAVVMRRAATQQEVMGVVVGQAT